MTFSKEQCFNLKYSFAKIFLKYKTFLISKLPSLILKLGGFGHKMSRDILKSSLKVLIEFKRKASEK